MRYGSVCSGMEAASVAWHPLGWTPAFFSEIEPFPCAILSTRFPHTPNHGSLTEYKSWPVEPGAIDLLVGGTPCQSFSVAGLRKGLADPRGNLALTFLALADRLKPKWIVWENVPGVLSSNGGRDFGSFVGALGQLGYGWAMRILDAQHFGVPQRRRRVFVVACLGDWRAAAEVLSLREGLRGYLEAGGKKRKGVASDAGSGVEASGPVGVDFRHERFEKDGTVGTIQSKSTGGYSLNYAPGVAIPFRKSKRACSTTDNESRVPADVTNTLNNFDLGDTRTTHAVVEPCIVQESELRLRGQITEKDVFPTLTAGAKQGDTDPLAVHAITFQPGNLRREAGAEPSTTTTTTLKASAGDQTPHVAYPVLDSESFVHKGFKHASTQEENAREVLQVLQCEVGEEAFAEWRSGILDSLQCEKVLRAFMHGEGVRRAAHQAGLQLGDSALSCKESLSARGLFQLWEEGPDGRSPQGRELAKQLARQSGKTLPWMPHQATPAMAVRRLTPVETERLQGFPDNWSRIPWKGKPEEDCPDGPRYKACGNSMAVPVMRWIGERIHNYELNNPSQNHEAK